MLLLQPHLPTAHLSPAAHLRVAAPFLHHQLLEDPLTQRRVASLAKALEHIMLPILSFQPFHSTHRAVALLKGEGLAIMHWPGWVRSRQAACVMRTAAAACSSNRLPPVHPSLQGLFHPEPSAAPPWRLQRHPWW